MVNLWEMFSCHFLWSKCHGQLFTMPESISQPFSHSSSREEWAEAVGRRRGDQKNTHKYMWELHVWSFPRLNYNSSIWGRHTEILVDFSKGQQTRPLNADLGGSIHNLMEQRQWACLGTWHLEHAHYKLELLFLLFLLLSGTL